MATFALITFTCWRVTRLLVEDTLPWVAKPRAWVGNWATAHKQWWLEDLLTCPHCVSVWVCGAVVAVAAQVISVPLPVLVAGAAAGVCSIIADFRPEH